MKSDLVRILADSLRIMGVEPIPFIEVEVPPNETFGDLATPVAMSLSKVLRRPPRKIGEDIVSSIKDKTVFEKIDIAGPGFINFTFSSGYIYSEIRKLLLYGNGFLRTNTGKCIARGTCQCDGRIGKGR